MRTFSSQRQNTACIEWTMGRFAGRSNAAFSLIEVSVAVLIVVILASLSIPAFSSARSIAASMRCISNLRQLQQANITYVGTHDGGYVPVFINGSEAAASGRVLWTGNSDFLNLLDISQTVNSTSDLKKAWPRQLLCPKATIDGGRIDRCYAYNRTGITAIYSKPGAKAMVRSMEIPYPSKVIAFVDAVNWMMDYDVPVGDYIGEVTQDNTVAYRHNGRANAVFFDGHVESLSKEQITAGAELWRIK